MTFFSLVTVGLLNMCVLNMEIPAPVWIKILILKCHYNPNFLSYIAKFFLNKIPFHKIWVRITVLYVRGLTWILVWRFVLNPKFENFHLNLNFQSCAKDHFLYRNFHLLHTIQKTIQNCNNFHRKIQSDHRQI